MAFEWSEKRIQWYLDASRYGDFHRRLADVIAPYLLPEDRLCDLGCGLGRLALQLAPRVGHITCVDINERVIESLGQEAARTAVPNLSTRCCDACAVEEAFDLVLMTFFGHPPQLMFDCMGLATGRWCGWQTRTPTAALYSPKNLEGKGKQPRTSPRPLTPRACGIN